MDKIKVYENQIYKEANLFTQPDQYYNYEEFRNKNPFKKTNNTLLVSGFSGSGKSTLARQLAQREGAEFVELDDFKKLIDSNPNAPIVKEFLKKNPELKNKIGQTTYKKYFPQYLEFAKDYTKRHPRKKYVLEGIQLLDHDDPVTPRVVKGTGVLRSNLQANKRTFSSTTKQKGAGYEFLNASLAPKMKKEMFKIKKLQEGYKPNQIKELLETQSKAKKGAVGALAAGATLGLTAGNHLFSKKKSETKTAEFYEREIYKEAGVNVPGK